MTDLLSDPDLSRLLACVADDPSAALPCVDRLYELGAQLRDVLLLFRGTPPEFTEGLPQCVLVAWLKANEPEKQVFDKRRRIPVAATAPFWPRWEAVAALELSANAMVEAIGRDPVSQQMMREHMLRVAPLLWRDGEAVVEPPSRDPRAEGVNRRAMAACVRDLKRRVLGLFPEVSINEECRLSLSHVDGSEDLHWLTMNFCRCIRGERERLAAAGWSVEQLDNMVVTGWEATWKRTIAAPDWIPPEPLSYTARHGIAPAIMLPWNGEEPEPLPAMRTIRSSRELRRPAD